MAAESRLSMGEEIATAHFRYHDFQRFERLLRDELALLQEWFRDRAFSSRRSIAGHLLPR